jgi:hypothetical protein
LSAAFLLVCHIGAGRAQKNNSRDSQRTTAADI